MATLQIQSTKGDPVLVIYPAAKPVALNFFVTFRLGKKFVQPAYGEASLPYLVQFQRGQRAVIFLLSDVLQNSFWQRIRNAYNVLGQLDIDPETKIGSEESRRAAQWLLEQSTAQGICVANN